LAVRVADRGGVVFEPEDLPVRPPEDDRLGFDGDAFGEGAAGRIFLQPIGRSVLVQCRARQMITRVEDGGCGTGEDLPEPVVLEGNRPVCRFDDEDGGRDLLQDRAQAGFVAGAT
jgi:hypothetical protein